MLHIAPVNYIKENQSATLECYFESYPSTHYYIWYFKNNFWQNTTSNKVTIPHLHLSQSGLYTCKVHYLNMTLESSSKLDVICKLFCSMTTTQKIKFPIKDFFSKCDQIRRKFLMENFIFCIVGSFVCSKLSQCSRLTEKNTRTRSNEVMIMSLLLALNIIHYF